MSELLQVEKEEEEKPRKITRIVDTGLLGRQPEANTITPIRGPLGIWPFPILNLIYLFLMSLFGRFTVQQAARPRRRTTIYEIVRDEEGRIVEILEREVVE